MMEIVLKARLYLVLLLSVILVVMIEGKTESNTEIRELHNVFRFLQPFEVKPVRMYPDLHREADKTLVATRIQRALLDIEPQVNESYVQKTLAKYGNMGNGGWPFDQRFAIPSGFQIAKCPACKACPEVTACPVNPKCDPNPPCPENSKCLPCPALTGCPSIRACDEITLTCKTTCEPIAPCSDIQTSCPATSKCTIQNSPYPSKIDACPQMTPCPAAPRCPSLTYINDIIRTCSTTTIGIYSMTASSAYSGFIDIPFSTTSTSCNVGISPPFPFTKVRISCTAVSGSSATVRKLNNILLLGCMVSYLVF